MNVTMKMLLDTIYASALMETEIKILRTAHVQLHVFCKSYENPVTRHIC
jgi:hypothetical protein